MYSVLIQNQKTMDSFQEFHPIFSDAMKKGKIDVCQWMEGGTTIETAIPEIYRLTEGKEEWRAVIVQVGEEGEAQRFPTASGNPYDFVENDGSDIRVKESRVPLIRLAQMLGGVPAPQVHVEQGQIQGKNGDPRMAYFTRVNEDDKKAHRALCEKYHFYGTKPAEILLVSLTWAREEPEEALKKTWELRQEDESSTFWSRNAYPSACRFIFYEMRRQGLIHRTADLFQVWTAVLMLATNVLPANVLQAYKLYRLELDLDRGELQAALQKAAVRAFHRKRYISRLIQAESGETGRQEAEMPKYRREVPVVFQPPGQGFRIGRLPFGLASHSVDADLRQWDGLQEGAKEQIRATERLMGRTLCQAAEQVRSRGTYAPKEVLPLTTFQLQDFTGELEGLRADIFQSHMQLRERALTDQKELDSCGKRVKERIRRRVTARQAAWGYLGMIALFLITFLPDLTVRWKAGVDLSKPAGYAAFAALSGIFLYGAAEIVQLLLQNFRLHRDIRAFARRVNAAQRRILEDAKLFSDYLGDMASYLRGHSYLNILAKNQILRNEEQQQSQNDLAALNILLMELQSWAAAFYLAMEPEDGEEEEDEMDIEDASFAALSCIFGEEDSHRSFLNTTDDTLESPFAFVKRLRITREERYDDAR